MQLVHDERNGTTSFKSTSKTIKTKGKSSFGTIVRNFFSFRKHKKAKEDQVQSITGPVNLIRNQHNQIVLAQEPEKERTSIKGPTELSKELSQAIATHRVEVQGVDNDFHDYVNIVIGDGPLPDLPEGAIVLPVHRETNKRSTTESVYIEMVSETETLAEKQARMSVLSNSNKSSVTSNFSGLCSSNVGTRMADLPLPLTLHSLPASLEDVLSTEESRPQLPLALEEEGPSDSVPHVDYVNTREFLDPSSENEGDDKFYTSPSATTLLKEEELLDNLEQEAEEPDYVEIDDNYPESPSCQSGSPPTLAVLGGPNTHPYQALTTSSRNSAYVTTDQFGSPLARSLNGGEQLSPSQLSFLLSNRERLITTGSKRRDSVQSQQGSYPRHEINRHSRISVGSSTSMISIMDPEYPLFLERAKKGDEDKLGIIKEAFAKGFLEKFTAEMERTGSDWVSLDVDDLVTSSRFTKVNSQVCFQIVLGLAREKNFEAMLKILQSYKAMPDGLETKDKSGSSVLHELVKRDMQPELRYISDKEFPVKCENGRVTESLQRQASIFCVKDADGKTPYQIAIEMGDVELVKLSLNHYVVKDELVLHQLAKQQENDKMFLAVVKWLGLGALLNIDQDGYTPLHILLFHGRTDLVQDLEPYMPRFLDNCEMKDENFGRTLLFYAVALNQTECVQLFLKRRSKSKDNCVCTRKDIDGDSPMEIVMYHLRVGVNVVNKRNPVDLAKSQKILGMLLKAKAEDTGKKEDVNRVLSRLEKEKKQTLRKSGKGKHGKQGGLEDAKQLSLPPEMCEIFRPIARRESFRGEWAGT